MTDKYNKDFYDDYETPKTPENEENIDNTNSYDDISSSSTSENSENSQNGGSYEWNTDTCASSDNAASEYHYSYVNGQNQNANHNPNNYDEPYTKQNTDTQNAYANSYQNNSTDTNSYQSQYNGYSQPPYSETQYPSQSVNTAKPKKTRKKKEKKPSKPVTRKALAAAIIITLICSSFLGIGGGYAVNKLTASSSSSGLNINKVSSSNTTNTSESSAQTTSSIVKKTADSVVEIATEGVQTGSFARQYVTEGAGSGVIISDDGYIITNYHVIEGANNITVTLRDGNTSYTAKVVGSDSDNDIALLKIDAKGLSAVTFGDSSKLAVGDYVVAIGNPLGELGGTVTDGIISALAREVTIEDKSMTLLQTNAQISPGNSGGGLFNANGELVGIVNAKDSATEVEGIAFAIPINNVIDIIGDLKTYGYVTGKVSLGMQLTDISSKETAFYYGVNQLGCYVLSVTSSSNAEKAGFKVGDLITKVNGTDVSSSADVDKALKNAAVGDTVKITVSRSSKTTELNLTLEEYTPSDASKTSNGTNSSGGSAQTETTPQSNGNSDSQSDDSIWSQMFGW